MTATDTTPVDVPEDPDEQRIERWRGKFDEQRDDDLPIDEALPRRREARALLISLLRPYSWTVAFLACRTLIPVWAWNSLAASSHHAWSVEHNAVTCCCAAAGSALSAPSKAAAQDSEARFMARSRRRRTIVARRGRELQRILGRVTVCRRSQVVEKIG